MSGRIQDFFRRGCTCLLLYFNTNKLHSFFLQNTSCIRKPQVISGGGGVRTPCTLPLDPPLRVSTRLTPDPNIQRSIITIIATTMFHHMNNNVIERTKLQTGDTQWWWQELGNHCSGIEPRPRERRKSSLAKSSQFRNCNAFPF